MPRFPREIGIQTLMFKYSCPDLSLSPPFFILAHRAHEYTLHRVRLVFVCTSISSEALEIQFEY